MKSKFMGVAAIAATLALGLSACGSASGSGDVATVDNGDKKDLTVVVFNGWDEGVAASELWKAVLDEKGYNVNLKYADAAPVYSGLSSGDYDVVLDTWLPITHKDYIDEYGDKMVDLGAWNENAKLTIAVNEAAPIDSLEELAANADKFGGKIIGIEPGAGLTRVTTEDVILDLKDPQGTLGEAEGIHSFSRLDFDKDYPKLDGWLKNFKMDSETLYSLENVMFNGEGTDDYTEIVKTWMGENQEYVDSLTP